MPMVFKDIFSANKDMEGGKLLISSLGMMKLNFTSPLINTEYFIARNE